MNGDIQPPIGPPCPECRADKHGNCDGGSWDEETDKPAICKCWLNGHEQ